MFCTLVGCISRLSLLTLSYISSTVRWNLSLTLYFTHVLAVKLFLLFCVPVSYNPVPFFSTLSPFLSHPHFHSQNLTQSFILSKLYLLSYLVIPNFTFVFIYIYENKRICPYVSPRVVVCRWYHGSYCVKREYSHIFRLNVSIKCSISPVIFTISPIWCLCLKVSARVPEFQLQKTKKVF